MTNIATPANEPLGDLTPENANEAAQAQNLRRMKMVATSMLVLAAIVFIVARGFEGEEVTWVNYVLSLIHI